MMDLNLLPYLADEFFALHQRKIAIVGLHFV